MDDRNFLIILVCVKARNGGRVIKDKEDRRERPLERFTVYLIHKWYEEGDSLKKIARMLDRDREQILRALAMPLTEKEKRVLERYRMRGRG